jgi:hypothetical protein
MTHLSFTSSFKKILPFFYGALCVLLCVASVNLLADKKRVYSWSNLETAQWQDFFKKYARTLLQAQSPLPAQETERLVKYYIGSFSQSPAYILGSSRALQISQSALKIPDASNLAVSGASFEDFLLFLGLLLQKNPLPQKVYIVIDPWFFAKNAHVRYMDFPGLYRKSLSAFPSFKEGSSYWHFLEKAKNLLNKDYFYYNISSYFKPKEDQISWRDNSYNTDGTLNYSKAYEERHQVMTPQAIESGFSYKMDYIKIDPDIVSKFYNAIQIAASKGLSFDFIVLPYAPSIHLPQFKLLKEKLLAFQRTLEEASANLGVPLRGSVLPDGYGLTEADYYDGIHLRRSGIHKVLRKPYSK